MVPVALHARHPEHRLRGQILQQPDRTHIGEIFPAQHRRLTVAAQLRQNARIHHRLEHALAVLVARPRVAQRERRRQTRQLRVALVDDDRRPVRPRPPQLPDRRTQRHAPMPRLLHVKQTRPKRPQRRRREQSAEVVLERPALAEALVAIERERKPVAAGLRQNLRHAPEPVAIPLRLAVDFDLKVPQPVKPDTRVERLRQPVGDALLGRDLRRPQRIRQAHGVARKQLRRRIRRQPVARRRAREVGLQRAQLDPEQIFPQRRRQRRAACLAHGVDQRPLDKRRAEVRQQRRQLFRRGPGRLDLVKLPPIRKRRRPADRPRVAHRRPDHAHHFLDLVLEPPRRVLGEPLGRKIVGRESRVRRAVDLERDAQDHVRQPRHRRDAVAKRHARAQIAADEFGVLEDNHESGARRPGCGRPPYAGGNIAA